MSRTIAKKLTVEPRVTLEFTESEMKALEALTGYGTQQFLDMFYKEMGKAYLQPHEQALRDLFEKFKSEFCPILRTTKIAREILERELKDKP